MRLPWQKPYWPYGQPYWCSLSFKTLFRPIIKVSKSKSKRTYPINGFTLIDSLLALLVASILSLLLSALCMGVMKMASQQQNHQQEWALIQIRLLCAQAESAELKHGQIELTLMGKVTQLVIEKHRIVKKEGYEILMEQVDGRFFEKEKILYLQLGPKAYALCTQRLPS